MGRSRTILFRLTTFLYLSAMLVGNLPETALAVRRGQPGPDFTLTDLDGRSVRLHALRGRDILLFFGTTWCPHCEAALPILEDFSTVLDDEALKVIFVTVRQNAESLSQFFADKARPYTVLLDETGAISEQYGIKRIPTCVFIDEQGLVQ